MLRGRGRGRGKLLSASTSALQSEPRDIKSNSMPETNSQRSIMRRKKKRFGGAAEQLKKIKRTGSTFVANVPIIGPGSPVPTVVKDIPQKQKNRSLSLALLGGEGVSTEFCWFHLINHLRLGWKVFFDRKVCPKSIL